MAYAEECPQTNVCNFEKIQTEKCQVALLSCCDLIAEGIAQSLANHEHIIYQQRYNLLEEFFACKERHQLDVILISSRALEYPLTEFFKRVQNLAPQARFIVFAAESEQQFQKSLMQAGVYGFVPANSSMDELYKAVLAVKAGQLWFNKALLDEMIFGALELERLIECSVKDRVGALKDKMTKRERDVFCLILEGLSTREIAEQIHMSEPTVKQHLTRLFKKFDVNNRSQLILSAFEQIFPVENIVKLFHRSLNKYKTDCS